MWNVPWYFLCCKCTLCPRDADAMSTPHPLEKAGALGIERERRELTVTADGSCASPVLSLRVSRRISAD